jgi:hypothetical protein
MCSAAPVTPLIDHLYFSPRPEPTKTRGVFVFKIGGDWPQIAVQIRAMLARIEVLIGIPGERKEYGG